MAKFHLSAGAEVDFLTEEELGRRLDSLAEAFAELQREQEGSVITHSAGPFKTDASGNVTALGGTGGAPGIYRVPAGYDAYLTRATFDYEGSNAAVPFSCDVRILRGQNSPSSLVALINALPNVFSASKSHAPLFRSGELICASVSAGPTTTSIYPTVQVILVRNRPVRRDVVAQVPDQ